MAEREKNTTESHVGSELDATEMSKEVTGLGRGLAKSEDTDGERVQNGPECVVCLQSYHHPVQLPCGHVFCFLCVKGVAARSRRCALCRADVPVDYFDNPVVVKSKSQPQSVQSVVVPSSKNNDTSLYKWYYEGRNGWWQYEDRASVQLEDAFLNEEQSTELVIAGFVYIVDIKDMVQYRKNYPTRRRRVKRDKASADKKGVAGLKSNAHNELPSNAEVKPSEQEVLEKSDTVSLNDQDRLQPEDEVHLVTAKLDKTL